jgi:alpha-tubulin suppressor-like RCC1 family protein
MSGIHQAVIGSFLNLIPALQLWTWGSKNNTYGELGQNSQGVSASTPAQVGGLTDWATVSVGSAHLLAIKTNGTMWSWGRNTLGQLGQNNVTNRSSPVQIGALTEWAHVHAGGQTSVAVKTNGTLWTWGSNGNGQLGLGNTIGVSSPVQVGALTNWKTAQITGIGACVAIKTDGTMWAWGLNSNGQLGQGNTTARSSPVQIGALTDWAELGATTYTPSCVAIKTDGTMWSWGRNNSGQLGTSNTIDRSAPVQIGALTEWAKVGPAGSAIKTTGTLWTWGGNDSGSLGLGNATNRSSPVQVGALTNWHEITGGRFKLAIKTDNTLWAWGTNRYGQLGNGYSGGPTSDPAVSSPVQVGGLTKWYKVGSVSYSYGTGAALRSP